MSARPGAAPSPHDPGSVGFSAALAAYLIWGLAPIYFKSLARVPPLEILAHRVVWSVGVLTLAVAATRRWSTVRQAFASRRALKVLLATTALISANWLIFIWAVTSGRLLEASLGYFVNPLVNVALGAAFLRESLSRRQVLAVAIAAVGVAVLVVDRGSVPWVPLALALTFGVYGLLRKAAQIDAIGGLLVETLLLAPLAATYLVVRESRGDGAFGGDPELSALLAAAGVITAVPLVLFAAGVRRLRLSTIGLIQFVAPTTQFLLAVIAYREPVGRAHAVAFPLIWLSLAIYTSERITGFARAPRGER
jgi:chloramphenicol-sensitive protein RarD